MKVRNGLVDFAQIWNWRCPTLRTLTPKILCVSVWGVLSYRCVKMAFSLLLYNAHLSVARPRFLGFLGRTMCLDLLWFVPYGMLKAQVQIRQRKSVSKPRRQTVVNQPVQLWVQSQPKPTFFSFWTFLEHIFSRDYN